MFDLGIDPKDLDATNVVLVILYKLSNNSCLRISPCGSDLSYLITNGVDDLICDEEETILAKAGIFPTGQRQDTLLATPIVNINTACEQLNAPCGRKKPSTFFSQPYEDEDSSEEVEPDWDYL